MSEYSSYEHQLFSNLLNEVCKNKKLQDTAEFLESNISRIAKNASSYILSTLDDDVNFEFKKKHTFQDRVKMYEDLVKLNPLKIPIVVEFDDKNINKSLKFLFDYDEIVMRLLAKIRGLERQSTSSSLFILTDTNRSLMATQTIGEFYKEYLCEKERMGKECDKILYLKVFTENTFGG